MNFKNGELEGNSIKYYINGNLQYEIDFKNGEAISGYMYNIDGKKTKMTNAHLHNYINKYRSN